MLISTESSSLIQNHSPLDAFPQKPCLNGTATIGTIAQTSGNIKNFSNALAGYSRRSASTAGLRQVGKTCELQMLGRTNRTCAAGLRHSVRPSNCKRGPLTGFEVPNVGHPFPFSFFLFPHLSFQSHISASFSILAAERPFFKPQGRPPTASLFSFLLRFKASQPTASPPAGS